MIAAVEAALEDAGEIHYPNTISSEADVPLFPRSTTAQWWCSAPHSSMIVERSSYRSGDLTYRTRMQRIL